VFRETGIPAVNDDLIEHIGRSAVELLAQEVFLDFPAIDWSVPLALDELVALRAYLEEKRQFLLQPEAVLRAWRDTFVNLWTPVLAHMPDEMFRERGERASDGLVLTRPLIEAMHEPARALDKWIAAVASPQARPMNTFHNLLSTIEGNGFRAAGVSADSRASTTRSPLLPSECREPVAALPDLFTSGTPFRGIFDLPVDLVVPRESRFEHCHIVAGTGHGKTQLMQSMILADLDAPDRPAVVAIDSQGDMMRTLSRLQRFGPAHDDRLIILDPADTEWPLRLNLFDVNRDRIDALPRAEREQLLAGIIELYDYIFGALLGAELTQKQAVVFRFLAQLMLNIPDATIQTLRQLLEDPTPYWSHIEALPVTARTFLTEHLFATPTKRGSRPSDYGQTRAQVLRRLYGILANPTFERIFSHPRNALDVKQALDSGKVILVNTAKDVLKDEASAIFGRYVIALVAKATLERAADPHGARRPAMIYIDEASDYFDDTIDTLLIQARKYNVGITVAHQFMDQLTPALSASVMSNPAIRFAGGLSAKDATALKDDMRTSSDFLMSMRKSRNATEFACFARNVTPSAMRYDLKLLQAEREPQMSASAYRQLIDRNRSEIAASFDEVDAMLAATPDTPIMHEPPPIEVAPLSPAKPAKSKPAAKGKRTPPKPAPRDPEKFEDDY